MKSITKIYQSALKQRKKQMKLGFHSPLTKLYIFVKNEGNCLWYWLDDGRKIYIQESALTGIIRSLEVKEASTSHGDRMKLDIELVADRRYILRSGIDSAFSRGMLMLIAALSDEQLKQPVTIEVKPGDETGNVLVSGRDPKTFESILTGKWEGVNWDLLLNRAIARLGSPQPQPKISQKQYEDLLAKVKSSGYTMARFSKLLLKYGFSRGGEITQGSYPQIWAEVGDREASKERSADRGIAQKI
jgi:hypothetical protein